MTLSSVVSAAPSRPKGTGMWTSATRQAIWPTWSSCERADLARRAGLHRPLVGEGGGVVRAGVHELFLTA